ncbi:MAG TPA: enoyl-CoA hydratase/isomerase family protein [Oligoflexia bacterium]|nr:enoyl-CoA hydratase/isomerase family protein [Oligoflexia bacterium]HMP47636.1 enoyl-CoA hydratase/isomerase family protein [Oligoflexia bacterium]
MLEQRKKEGLLILTFSNPKANCLSPELITEFSQVLVKCNNDWKNSGNPASIMISAEGEGVFSSGADLSVYRERDEQGIREYLISLGNLLIDLLKFPLPVITTINGLAVGGSLGLLAASDYVIASSKAEFRLPELSLGLAPSVISPFLLLRIGSGFLRSLSFSGEVFDADWGYYSGLVSEKIVASDSIEFNMKVEGKALKIAGRKQDPVSGLKAILCSNADKLPEIVENYAAINAKNIIIAKNNGYFSKKG